MKILYHNTIPLPRYEKTDAVRNEIVDLATAFKGDVIDLFPSRSKHWWTVKQLMGARAIRKLVRIDKTVDIHHVFFPSFYFFPYLKLLTKPIVFSATSSASRLGISHKWANVTLLSSNNNTVAIAQQNGFTDVHSVIPGVETSNFIVTESRRSTPFKLLMASAPHTKGQFNSKQIFLLLSYVLSNPVIELTLLWRGVEAGYMRQQIEKYGLQERVKLIDEVVKVQDYYNECHATILLCDEPGVLKNYPHSLLESICSGRPIITNNEIELSSIVSQHRLGVVLDSCKKDLLDLAVQKLMSRYDEYCSNCRFFNTHFFDQANYHDQLRSIYKRVF